MRTLQTTGTVQRLVQVKLFVLENSDLVLLSNNSFCDSALVSMRVSTPLDQFNDVTGSYLDFVDKPVET